MNVSALTSSLAVPLPEAIKRLAAMEFLWIDVPPSAAEDSIKQLISRLRVKVGCVVLERDQPEPFDLASPQRTAREKAVSYFREAIEKTADLQARVAYLTPPSASGDEVRQYWCDSLVELGDHAARYGVDVCIEHFPGRFIPSVRSAIELLDCLSHENLKLLIDVGHGLISREDPADSIRLAGKRLGYIHFDDNDGTNDLHWGLLKGQLTETQIAGAIEALISIGYERTLCLEFNSSSECETTLEEGKALLERLLVA